jgi:hypothetical protein
VMSNVRGANFYVEDGNEMYNRITYNVKQQVSFASKVIVDGCAVGL